MNGGAPPRQAARAALAWALGAGLLAAVPARGQEQVRIQVPESVTFEIADVGAKAVAPPCRMSFDQALLAPRHHLRISVKAEGLDLAFPGARPRIRFSARNARGGTGFSGTLREAGYTPVFEGDPFALSGGVEISWTLDPMPRLQRAGAHPVALRWQVESVPGDPMPGAGLAQPGGRPGPTPRAGSCAGASSCAPAPVRPRPEAPAARPLPPA